MPYQVPKQENFIKCNAIKHSKQRMFKLVVTSRTWLSFVKDAADVTIMNSLQRESFIVTL